MAEFPITLLLDDVGTVSWAREGLYYCYHAEITCPVEKFYRLYLHQEETAISLGIFSPKGELRGKVAANKIRGNELVFALTESLWYPKYKNVFGRCTVVATMHEGGETLFVRRYESLPQEVLPYVCFLCSTNIENLPGLTVTLDKQGRPLLKDNR